MANPKPRVPDFSKFTEEQLKIEIPAFKARLKLWREAENHASDMKKLAVPMTWKVPNFVYIEKTPIDYLAEYSQPIPVTPKPVDVVQIPKDILIPVYVKIPEYKPSFTDYLAKFKSAYTIKYNNSFVTTNQILLGSLLRKGHPGLGYKVGNKFNKDGIFVSSTILFSYSKPIVTFVKSHTSKYSTLYQLYIELLKLMLLKESRGGYSIEVHVKPLSLNYNNCNIVSHLVRPPEKVSLFMILRELEVE